MISIELEKIAERDPKLYIAICDVFLIRGTDNVKVLTIPEAKFNWLAPEVRERVQHWERTFESESDVAQQQRATEDEEKQRKINADTEAYKARILQYASEQGLELSQQNAELIRTWLEGHQSINGYMSQQNADAAISVLRPKLSWKPKVAPPPPTPPPPPVVKLSDGSDQLPLDAMPTYNHTKAQLKDLAKRQIAEKKQDRKGWHSVSL